MTWTATLLSANKKHGRLRIEISYEDNDTNEVINKVYDLDKATKKSIRSLARAEVNRMEILKNEVIDLPVGISIDITPDTPPIPVPPTPEEIARRAWFTNWSRMLQFLALVDAGLMQFDDTRIISLRASLLTDWLNSYMDGI